MIAATATEHIQSNDAHLLLLTKRLLQSAQNEWCNRAEGIAIVQPSVKSNNVERLCVIAITLQCAVHIFFVARGVARTCAHRFKALSGYH